MTEIKQVIVSRFAEDDLDEIAAYYASLSPSYVRKTVQQFEDNVMSLKENPLRGRVVPELEKFGYTRYRELIQGNYRIVYEVANDTVIVHVVIDGRRDFESIIFSKLSRYYDEF
jgi:toxin ParE1/3/4